MGGFWSKDDLSADFVQELMDETGFNQKQIHRLYIRFRHLDKDKKGYLTKEDLLRLPQVNIIIFYKTRRKRVKRLHSGTTSDKLILKFYEWSVIGCPLLLLTFSFTSISQNNQNVFKK